MADVFISYARADASLARRIADNLKTAGYEVWWDSELLPHHAFAQSIEQEVRSAQAVLVLWSEGAVNSQWVRAEADLARSQNKLVQIIVNQCVLPLPFNQIQAADLRHWKGDSSDSQWSKVLASIAQLTSKSASVGAIDAKAASRFNVVGRAIERHGPTFLITVAIAAVLLASAAVGGLWFLSVSHQPLVRGTRIAVQPFDTIGGTPALRDFAAGLSESLEDTLNQDQQQTVSPSDAQTLRGADLPARLKALDVGLLFSGTVQGAADTVTVRTHLEDPVQHTTLWSADISGPIAALVPLQARVNARAVAVLNCSAQALNKKGGIAGADALALFLHACDLAETSDHGISGGKIAYAMLDAMREVARQAPDFAPAHSILAKHAAFVVRFLPGHPMSLRVEAVREAHRALQLDPKDPDGYVALGLLAPTLDFGQQEHWFRLALASNPSWSHANGFLGNTMTALGRLSEATTLYERAASVNPEAKDWSHIAAASLFQNGNGKEADEQLTRLDQLWPNDPFIHSLQLDSLEAQNRWGDALKFLDTAGNNLGWSEASIKRSRGELVALSTHNPASLSAARRQAADLASTYPQGAIISLARLGFVNDAFAAAQRYSPIRSDGTDSPAFLFEPALASLRQDARFMTLAIKFGLPQYWRNSGKWPDFCSDRSLPYNCQQEAAKLTPTAAH
jgi:TolB-like protein